MKDALISAYHYFTGVGIFSNSISMEQYVEMFMTNKLPFHPFWDHTLEFWEMRNQPNVYFTSYERMSKDLRSVIKDLCMFLGKPVPDESILDKAVKHLSFENMKSEYVEKLFGLNRNFLYHRFGFWKVASRVYENCIRRNFHSK